MAEWSDVRARSGLDEERVEVAKQQMLHGLRTGRWSILRPENFPASAEVVSDRLRETARSLQMEHAPAATTTPLSDQHGAP